MSKQTQLIITHGNSDLQLLVTTEDGQLFRALTNARETKEFHEWILAEQEQFELVELPQEAFSRDKEIKLMKWRDGSFSAEIKSAETTLSPALSNSGKMQLVLPKIAPVINDWLTAQQETTSNTPPANAMAAQLAGLLSQNKNQPIHSALVLSTKRENKPDEPLASFKYIQQYLVQQGVAEDDITELVYLNDGDERIEDKNKLIKNVISNRLETRIRHFYDFENNPQLAIVSIGGIPIIKEWLFEYCRLLAGKKVINLDKTENAIIGERELSKLDEIKIRRLCVEQIKRGALLHAYAMAAPFHSEPSAENWVKPLEAAADLINGNPIKEYASAPLPSLQKILKASHTANCLLVAIRVEHALLTNLWLDAVVSSVTFSEVALKDAIRNWAANEAIFFNENWGEITLTFQGDNLPPQILLTSESLKEKEKLGSYLVNLKGKTTGKIKIWGQVLSAPIIYELNNLVYGIGRNNGSLMIFRNIHAHNILSQQDIDKAIKSFMHSSYWAQHINIADNKPRPGDCFLSRPIVTETIQAIMNPDEVQPADLFNELLTELEKVLICPTIQF